MAVLPPKIGPVTVVFVPRMAQAYMDYFTDAEYRAVTGDTSNPFEIPADDVLRCQQEVVERLESWARTSWTSRRAVVTKRVSLPRVALTRLPVISVQSVLVDGELLEPDDYELDAENGIMQWSDWTYGIPYLWPMPLVEIIYTYGYGHVPAAVKRPAIQATRLLAKLEEGRVRLPRDISSYGTERAQFQKRSDRGLIKPWSWDERDSQDVRSYWESYRTRTYLTSA
jgi:hypothetical protein